MKTYKTRWKASGTSTGGGAYIYIQASCHQLVQCSLSWKTYCVSRLHHTKVPACKRKLSGLPVWLQLNWAGVGRRNGSSHACKRKQNMGERYSVLTPRRCCSVSPVYLRLCFETDAATSCKRQQLVEQTQSSTARCNATVKGLRSERHVDLTLLTSFAIVSSSSDSGDMVKEVTAAGRTLRPITQSVR